MSFDILGTSCDQCRSTVQKIFTSTETRRLVRTDSPGRPPRLSHSSWTMRCIKIGRLPIYAHLSLPPTPTHLPGWGSSISIDCSPFLPSTLLNSQYGIVPLPCPTYWPLELWIKNSVCMCVCVCVWGGGGAIYLYMYSNPSTPHPPLPPRQVSSSTPSHQPSYLCLWPTYGNVFTSSSAGHSSSLETNSYENKGMSQAKQWDLLVSEFTYPLCNHN